MMRRILRDCQQGRERFQLAFSLLAAPEIDYFVGRASNLASIESVLLPFTTTERKVVVLQGLGGIGKSQLAIEFAKKHRSDYTAVFWFNAKTEDTLKRSFAANARRLPKEFLNQELLDGPQNEKALDSIIREIKTWLGLPGNDRWLLIYDNVDNPKIPGNKTQHAYDIRSYFPEAHQGSVLVTTRWRTLRIGHSIEVAKLSEDEESISLLIQMSGRAIGEGGFLRMMLYKPMLTLRKDPSIKYLAGELDGLPLALATAGAYLGLTGISVSKYLEHYKKSWLELHRTSPLLPSYDQTIYSTWDLSYIYIRKEDESAAKLLELWAYFDNRDLWYDLLRAGKKKAPGWFLDIISTELGFLSAIGKLRKHALIESLTDSDGYSMHHCVHAWVKSVLWKAKVEQHMMLACACIGKSVSYQPAPGDWIIMQRLFPHAERCLQLLGVWRSGRELSEPLVDGVAEFLSHLGRLYHSQGKLTDAESMYQRALAGHKKALGEDHLFTLSTANNLGVLYRDQGKLAEAESMYQRALLGYTRNPPTKAMSKLNLFYNMGLLYRDTQRFEKAKEFFRQAHEGYQELLGSQDAKTIRALGALNTEIERNKDEIKSSC